MPNIDYTAMRDELAAILCTDPESPCEACVNTAYRVIAKRRSVRRALIRFAQQEAVDV